MSSWSNRATAAVELPGAPTDATGEVTADAAVETLMILHINLPVTHWALRAEAVA